MVATQVAVAVVGHRRRERQAHRLARGLDARLVLDPGNLGEWANHRRAWAMLAHHAAPWSLVLQDDAVPVPDLLDHVAAGLDHLPEPGVMSLYLGTGYPTHWQQRIGRAVDRAASTGSAWIRSSHLFHGVAVMVPTTSIADLVEYADRLDLPYDERVGAWARATRRLVFYSLPSLVDHADGPTLVDHADGRPRTARRRAWSVGVPVWNRQSVNVAR